MYKIVLKNVGKDMVNKEFTVYCNGMNEAVVQASLECSRILKPRKGMVFDVVSNEVSILVRNVIVGSIEITKLH